MANYTFISNSPESTTGLGKAIGKRLREGSVIALTGELGCGKTVLTRGICDGLGVPLRQVNSPTFILVNEYQGRLSVFHMDMYQINTESDAVELGIIDYMARAAYGVMIVEWAERILLLLPNDLLKVDFRVLSARKRRLEFSTQGDRYNEVLKETGIS